MKIIHDIILRYVILYLFNNYRVAIFHFFINFFSFFPFFVQVAYCHYLVPDLEKITSCCYYWGKMDRYEAEKLLEGKAEGTFLLRDSAQDDYLFSVSFRKYGRSLHARIEVRFTAKLVPYKNY